MFSAIYILSFSRLLDSPSIEFVFPYEGAHFSQSQASSLDILMQAGGNVPSGSRVCISMYIRRKHRRQLGGNGCIDFPFRGESRPSFGNLETGSFEISANLVSAQGKVLSTTESISFEISTGVVLLPQRPECKPEALSISPRMLTEENPATMLQAPKSSLNQSRFRFSHLVHDTTFNGFPANNRFDFMQPAGIEPYSLLGMHNIEISRSLLYGCCS